MNLHSTILVEDQLREDINISIAISQLPVRQVDLILPFVTHYDPFSVQCASADHTHNLDWNINFWIERWLCCNRLIERWAGGLDSREAHRTVITVVPEQDRARDTGRNKYVQEQVVEESAAIHVL